jgi:hypothetical protein
LGIPSAVLNQKYPDGLIAKATLNSRIVLKKFEGCEKIATLEFFGGPASGAAVEHGEGMLEDEIQLENESDAQRDSEFENERQRERECATEVGCQRNFLVTLFLNVTGKKHESGTGKRACKQTGVETSFRPEAELFAGQ